MLVVNVATYCGYTDSNYRELQALRAKYDEDKLAILAFPCNQFGAQEPGTHEEILSFVDKQYGVTFSIMNKVLLMSVFLQGLSCSRVLLSSCVRQLSSEIVELIAHERLLSRSDVLPGFRTDASCDVSFFRLMYCVVMSTMIV